MLRLPVLVFIFAVSSQNVSAHCYSFSLNSTTDTTTVSLEHDLNAFVDISHFEVEGRRKLFLHISSTVSGLASAKYRKDYELFPEIGYYKMHTQATSWNQARIICVQEGGHLAIINSEAEYGVIKEIYNRNLPIKDARWDTAAWIGLHDRFKEGEYITVFGQPLQSTGYTRWWAGQPNNNVEGKEDEDCVAIEKFDDMSDLACSTKLAFFCEIPLQS